MTDLKIQNIHMPDIPMFIKKKRTDAATHIKHFTNEELTMIGEEWVRALIAKAVEARRKDGDYSK